jgi:hypothetical protein
MAATANLFIEQGATFTSDVTIKDSVGEPFDLTGYSASAKMALGYASTRTRVTINTSIYSDPTTGIITLSLTPTETSNLEAPARYVYDVEILKTSDNSVVRVIQGIITVSPNVTI